MRGAIGRFKNDVSGAVAPTVALSLVGLIAAGGIAFDYARLASLDTELQQAADQAALAAATQLDGEAGAAARAVAAAQSLLENQTFFANDQGGVAVATGQSDTDGQGNDTRVRVNFYSNRADAEADTNSFTASAGNADADAKFVKVEVSERKAVYALTPIVAAIDSGDIGAAATAGISSAVCKVPPLMICNPKPGITFDPDAMKGIGIQVTGHGNDRSGTSPSNTAWGPGDFGFLDVGAGQNSDLIKALAFQDIQLKCYETTTGKVTTGNPQGVYDAINTRFDIYDFSSGNGTTLAGCFSGKCPPAKNTIKDLFKNDATTNGNGCKITTNNQGWHVIAPPADFSPIPYAAGQTVDTRLDTNIALNGMGLPRDNCHYLSYGRACNVVNGTSGTTSQTNKFGDGKWARADYFATLHGGTKPSGWQSITRYDTYLWEIAQDNMPSPTSGTNRQYGRPVCRPSDTINAGTDRRVISVAVVENCASLSGSSRTVVISNWADMFLVEPTTDLRANGSLKDSVYMEVIGKTKGTGTDSQTAQTIRRDVPYLIR